MSGVEVDRSRPGERVAEHHRHGEGVVRVGYPIRVRRLRVLRTRAVSPTMLRLTLGGPELAGFHNHQPDDHVKLVFALPDGTRSDPSPNEHDMLDWPRPLPPTRDYTIRRHDPVAQEIDLDLVVHRGGMASDWAASVEPGTEVVVAGPPGAKAFPLTYDHYVFAVDVTALPAVARWLEEAPAGVSAHVVVDTDSAEDRRYPLSPPPGVEIVWLDRGAGSRLAATVGGLDLPAGRTFLFAAGEAEDIKPLRRWGREHCTDVLVTGYWKRGVAGFDD